MEFLLSQAEKENDCGGGGAEYGIMRRLIPEFIVCLQAILAVVCANLTHCRFLNLGRTMQVSIQISLLRPAPKAIRPSLFAHLIQKCELECKTPPDLSRKLELNNFCSVPD
jgi:hypothetical protein